LRALAMTRSKMPISLQFKAVVERALTEVSQAAGAVVHYSLVSAPELIVNAIFSDVLFSHLVESPEASQ
jgi:hypothetical protein